MHALLAAFALLAAQAAGVPDWQPLGASRGFNLSFDRGGVERSGDIVVVRVRRELVTTSAGTLSYVSRVELRCAANMSHVIETISYRADGSISRTATDPVPFETISPGSMIEVIHNQVCTAPAQPPAQR